LGEAEGKDVVKDVAEAGAATAAAAAAAAAVAPAVVVAAVAAAAPTPPVVSPPDVEEEGCWVASKSSRCSSRARRLAISLLSCLFLRDLLSTRGREEASISEDAEWRSGFRIKGGEDSEVVAMSSSISVKPKTLISEEK